MHTHKCETHGDTRHIDNVTHGDTRHIDNVTHGDKCVHDLTE